MRVYFTESAMKWLAAVRCKREYRNGDYRWGTVEMDESETTWIPVGTTDSERELLLKEK